MIWRATSDPTQVRWLIPDPGDPPTRSGVISEEPTRPGGNYLHYNPFEGPYLEVQDEAPEHVVTSSAQDVASMPRPLVR